MAHVGNGTADDEEDEVEVGVTLLSLSSSAVYFSDPRLSCAVNTTPFSHPTALSILGDDVIIASFCCHPARHCCDTRPSPGSRVID